MYDADRGTVTLLSDRHGLRPLYYYALGGRFAWASEVKALLALDFVDAMPDPESARCFFDLGHLLGDHTWFEHIRLLQPATMMRFSIEEKTSEHDYYWTWARIQPRDVSFANAVDDIGRLMVDAVARRFEPDERVGISLSGGLDSRMLFAAARALHPEYNGYAFTFGQQDCDDVRIARRVTSGSTWRHDVFEITEDNWFDSRLENIWTTDGMLSLKHMHGQEFMSEICRHADVNLHGFLGDAVLGGSYLLHCRERNTRITRRIGEEYYGTHADKARLDDAYLNVDHIEPGLIMNRGRRFIAMGVVGTLPYLEQRKPFFDNRLIEALFSLPDEYRLDNKLYFAALLKTLPAYFRSIPWQATGYPIARTGPAKWLAKGIQKAKRLAGTIHPAANKTQYANYAEWIRNKRVAARLREILDPRHARCSGQLGIDLLTAYLIPHLENRAVDHSDEILRAATMELYFTRLAATNAESA